MFGKRTFLQALDWRATLLLGMLSLGIIVYQRMNPKIVEKEVTKEVVRVEFRDKVVEKDSKTTKTTTKPDGTKVVVVKEEATKSTDKGTVKEKEELHILPVIATTNYSLKLSLPILPFPRYSNPSEYLIGLGVRLGGSPFWLELDTRPLIKELYIGIRYEF